MMERTLTTLIIIAASILPIFLSSVDAQQTEQPGSYRVNIAKNINVTIMGEPLDYTINTPYKELGPMPTKDGTRLYFSRQGFPGNTGGENDEDIWYSEFDQETQSWKKAVNPGPPLNNAGPNFITGVGRNGDTLLLANEYRKNGKMMAGVSVSIKMGNLWSFPVPVNVEADYNMAARASYDLSHDRKTLIIAEEKVDSNGKLDLYVAFRDPDGKHKYSGTESMNLGPVINTFGDETSPWLDYDGKTLYFASDGHNGFGKLDLFISKRLDDTWTNWSEPVNLGPGVNSPYDDFSFNYNPNDRYAYYARGLSSDNTDILRIDRSWLFIDDAKLSDIRQTKVVQHVFDDDQAAIKKEALTDLRTILEYLQKNKNIVVQLNAHSNIHPDPMQSITLSNDRAQKVIDFLVNNGIDKKRLSYQGLGHDIVASQKSKPDAHASKLQELASSVEFKLVNYDK